MKILICHRPGGAFGYISDSWINTLKDAGFTVSRWDGLPSTWSDFKPDLYIGCSGHRQNIPSHHIRGKTKVAIHVNPFGPVKIEPNINEQRLTIDWVTTHKPDVVFGYGFEKDRNVWSFWKSNADIPWVPMATAGDVTLYKPSNKKKTLDYAYIGGYWPYKANNIDKHLVPLFRCKLRYKVRGWGDWPTESKECTTDEKIDILQSSIVAPCVAEPHTTKYGIDLPERVFKTILCGAIAVHDPVCGLQKILPSVVGSGSLTDQVYNILDMPEKDRHELWLGQYNEVLAAHTYHHRLSGLLGRLGFEKESEVLLERIGKHNAV